VGRPEPLRAELKGEIFMDDKKKDTKTEFTEMLEPMGEAVVKASQTLTEMAKEAAEKAAPKVRAAARKAEPTAKAAGKAIKDTGLKAAVITAEAASALLPKTYVQWGESQISCAEVADKVKADFRANNKGAIRSCRIYIKPEDGMAYYVINDKEGKVSL